MMRQRPRRVVSSFADYSTEFGAESGTAKPVALDPIRWRGITALKVRSGGGPGESDQHGDARDAPDMAVIFGRKGQGAR
jgi:hypothetical protein